MPVIRFELRNHNKIEVVAILFESNASITEVLKNFEVADWSKELNCWYIPINKFDLSTAFDLLQPQAFIDYSALKTLREQAKNQIEPVKRKSFKCIENELPDGYLGLLEQKRYSDSTIRTYTGYFRDFMDYFDGTDMEAITADEINDYILGLIRNSGISSSVQNQKINAIKS